MVAVSRILTHQRDALFQESGSVSQRKPLVSIVIDNYNYRRYIGQAIESALAQTWQPLEVIVVDDGSTDGSAEELERWKDRVRVIVKPNGGQASSYNVGFAASRGDIVMFLDADDLIEPDAIETVVPMFTGRTARVHYRLRLIDAEGRPTGQAIPTLLSDHRDTRVLPESGYLYASSPGSGNVFARWAVEGLFPIPQIDGDGTGADFFIVYGSCLFGELRACHRVLGSYRVHARIGSRLSYIFGNHSNIGNERARRRVRAARFVDYIGERSGGRIRLPATLTDFSHEKEGFVADVMAAPTLGARWRAALLNARRFFRALHLIPNGSLVFKAVAASWALGVVVLPRALASRLGLYGSNPASR